MSQDKKRTSFFKLIPTWFLLMLALVLGASGFGLYQRILWRYELYKYDSQYTQQEQASTEAVQDEITLHGYAWLDKMPETPHAPFQMCTFIRKAGFGLHSNAESSFKMQLEIFEYRDSEGTLRYHFPHDNRTAKSEFTIEPCSGKAPFTHKLTIKHDPQNGGQTKVYYTCPELHRNNIEQSSLPQNLKSAILNLEDME